MAVRLIGVDSVTPRLPNGVMTATLPEMDVRVGGINGGGVINEGALLNTFLATYAGHAITIPKGFVIRTTVPIDPPTGTKIVAHGAKLLNACTGSSDRLLRLIGVSDVTIEGLELDGDKAGFAGATEQRHNIYMENAENVTIRDVYSHDAKGDGFTVSDGGVAANYCTNVTIDNCHAEANHRNGLSVVAVDMMRVIDSIFVNQSGTNPQGGVDVEPNAASGICRDVTFANCTMTGNVGPGLDIQTIAGSTTQGSYSVVNCEMSGNTDATSGRGMTIRNPIDFRVTNCNMKGNAAEGAYIDTNSTATGEGLTFVNCNASGNGREGHQVFNVNDVAWIGCEFNDNSTASTNTRDGLSLTPTSATTGHQVIGCRFNGTSQRYGVRTGSNLAKLTLIGNQYGTMGTGAASLGDEQGSRWRWERDGQMLSSTSAGTIVLRARENADANDRLLIRTDGDIRWGDGTNTPDVRLFRSAADVLRTVDSVQIDSGLLMAGTGGACFIDFLEQSSDPAAGSTNHARLFAKDNGAGKTELCVRFPTGATAVLATEP